MSYRSMIRPARLVCLTLGLALAATCQPAQAGLVYRWIADSGDFNDPENWSATSYPSAPPPGPEDFARFGRIATYTVSFSKNVTNVALTQYSGDVTFNLGGRTYTLGGGIGLGPTGEYDGDSTHLTIAHGTVSTYSTGLSSWDDVIDRNASLTVSTGGILSNSQNLSLAGHGTSTLTIQNGGEVYSYLGYIGYDAGSNCTATVDGTGSTWTNSGNLYVGFSSPGTSTGTGTLTILDGGEVYSGGGSVGSWNGSKGTATVDGTGSTWTNSSSLSVGGGGTGTLNIQNGGEVYSDWGSVGSQSGSNGTVTVDGTGSIWTNSSYLTVDETGTLTIQNGGAVYNQDGWVGGGEDSNATVTVDGFGSTWTNSSYLDVAGTLNVQNGGEVSSGYLYVSFFAGTGTLNIKNGGAVDSTDGYIGYMGDSNGTVTVDGTGSTWSSGFLSVGCEGTGTLTIQNGGEVSSGGGSVGAQSGSDGTVTVDGTGSTWRAKVGWLRVGRAGTGTLNIQNGGAVSNMYAFLGYESGSDGTVTVDGADSQWAVSDGLYIGGSRTAAGGTAELTVADGGTVDVGDTLHIWETGTVNLLEGTLTVDAGTFDSGTDEVTIDGGLHGGKPTVQCINDASGAITGELRVGLIGEGALELGPGATLQVARMELGPRATLSLQLTNAHTEEYVPIVVDQAASLDGTLKVERTGDFVTQFGDRFPLISYGALQGRFNKFEGAIIDDNTFFGLDYKKNQLNLITLETPRRIGLGGRLTENNQPANPQQNLILATHGWNSNADDWATPLALEMGLDATLRGHGTWDAVSFDWSEFVGFFNGPWAAANNGINIGESISLWLEDVGLVNYQNVHLLGHSAGSWLVDALADQLKAAGVNVHLTLLDAFAPSFGLSRPGAPVAPVLGDNAKWVDQIVDSRLFSNLLPVLWTNVTLPNAFNVDVTALDPDMWNAHGWPYEWYNQTVLSPEDPVTNMFGFPLSFEYSGSLPVDTMYAYPGGRVKLFPDGTATFTRGYKRRTIDLSQMDRIVSPTGTVTFEDNGEVILATGSPVMLTSFVELTEPASLVSFDFAFLSDAEGLLSVYFEGEQIFEFEESWLPEDVGSISSGDLWLGQEFEPDTYALLFRLDPLGDSQSLVGISNVQFGSHVTALISAAAGNFHAPATWHDGTLTPTEDYAIVVGDHMVTVAADGEAYSVLIHRSNARLVVDADATLLVVNRVELTDGALDIQGMLNAGSLQVGAGTLTTGANGTVNLDGDLEVINDVTVDTGGTLNVDGTLKAASVFSGGTISGRGTIEADYIEITGVVSPGSGIATLTFNGELKLLEATYLCEIDSSGADVVRNANPGLPITLSDEREGNTLELLVLEALGVPGCYTETILSTSGAGVIDGDFPDGQKPAEGDYLHYGVFLDGYETVDTGAGFNYDVNMFQAGRGDTDGDGDVDLDDLSRLDDGWDPTAEDKLWTDGDVDGDGDVDLDDLSLLDDNWAPAGYPLVNCGGEANAPLGGPAPVPEPGTLVLLCTCLGGLLAYAWRKRRRR